MTDLGEGGISSSLPEQGGYSTAYSDIVGDDDDLINMIAYCIYKKQKKEFVIKRKLAFNDSRVRNYHDDLNADRISTLRLAATSLLQDYANTIEKAIQGAEIDKIRNGAVVRAISDLIKENHTEIKSTIKSETKWWKAILYSVIGGFALGLVIVGANNMGFMNPFEALPLKNTAPTK